MQGQCESKLMIPNAMDVFECSLLVGHAGFHQESGTIPPFHDEDEVDGSITDDPEVLWIITWWECEHEVA